MNVHIDRQTLLGFLSATGLPAIFKAVIAFVHPALYTLYCGKAFLDGTPACYEDEKAEAILWLVLTLLAVGYGGMTLFYKLQWNPAPPAGARTAIIPNDQVPVTVDKNGEKGLQSAKANPGTTGYATLITPALVVPKEITPNDTPPAV